MRRVFYLTRSLLRDWLRNREAVFFAVLFPLVLLLVFSVVFAGGPTTFEVAVQNNDRTAAGEPTERSAALVDAVEAADPLTVERVEAGISRNGTTAIEKRTGHKRVLIVPAGFDAQVREGSGRARIAVIRDTVRRFGDDLDAGQREEIESGLSTLESGRATTGAAADLVLVTVPDDEGAGAVRSILQSVVARFNSRAIGVETPPARLDTVERGPADLDAADYFLPAFIVATILINALMTVPSTVARFKRDGTLKRLAATPLRKHEWILATVIQQSVLAVGTSLVLILVAWVGFGVNAVPGPLAIGLITLGAVAFTALGMILGGLVRDPGAAVSLGGAIALPLMFVSGIFWELDLMPPTLQAVAEGSPVTHFHRALRELMILHGTAGVAKTAALLAVLAGVFLTGAVWVTNWREFD